MVLVQPQCAKYTLIPRAINTEPKQHILVSIINNEYFLKEKKAAFIFGNLNKSLLAYENMSAGFATQMFKLPKTFARLFFPKRKLEARKYSLLSQCLYVKH